jgi:hypothetical protein
MLLYTFKSVNAELVSVSGQLVEQTRVLEERKGLNQDYKNFEEKAPNMEKLKTSYPSNPRELYTMVDNVLKANSIEYTNNSSSRDTVPGGEIILQINFTGPYYGLMKALAAFRDSQYIMRVGDFNVTGTDDGMVTGTMTILSMAKS